MAALCAKEECRRASLKRRRVRSITPAVPQDANAHAYSKIYGYSSELSEDDEPKTQVELPYWDDAAECWLEAPGVAACDVDVDQGPGSHDDDERDRNKNMTTEIPGGASEHAEDGGEATLEHCNELATMGVA